MTTVKIDDLGDDRGETQLDVDELKAVQGGATRKIGGSISPAVKTEATVDMELSL